MAVLTTKQRKELPKSSFAGPNRSYPIEDEAHARNALARASQNASPELQKKIRAKVHKRYPGIEMAKALRGK
jgi:hypothetical protein